MKPGAAIPALSRTDVPAHLDFLGHAPCLFKRTFKESFEQMLATHRSSRTDEPFSCYVPEAWSTEPGYIFEDLWRPPTSTTSRTR